MSVILKKRRAGRVGERLSLGSAAEAVPFLDRLTARLAALGYPEKEVFGIRLALEEAIVNGIKHGNRNDPARRIRIHCRAEAGRLRVRIADQGDGFDPEQVPDPTAPENLERPCGRGVYLMRAYMDTVCYNSKGNCVTLSKRRC